MRASTTTSPQSTRRAARRSMSLRLRLVLLVLLITIPVVALINILILARADELLTEDAEQQLLQVNRALSGSAQAWLDSHLHALQAMVSLPETARMERVQQTPILQTMTNAYPSLYLAQTVDLTGTNVARSDNGTPQINTDQQWFQSAKSGKTATELLLTREVYKPGLVIASPIKDEAGKIVGVGAISSNLDDLSSQVFASVIGRTGYGYIVDAEDHVVAHPDLDRVRADFSSAPPVVALRNRTVGPVTYVDERGVQWLAYVSRLENGWGIVVQEQMEELLSSVRPFQQIAWLALSLGVALLAALAWVVIGRALRPIKTLTQVATAAADGDLSQSASVRRDDEVGILAGAFNTMIARLRDLIGSLEQRVQARTEQLQASAEVSRAAVSILDTNELLRDAVNLITDRFGFYYAAVFLADNEGRWAVLRAATGEAGRILLERHHQLEIGGQSMVGTVTRTRQSRIALDVGNEAVRFANPLLPETRSEIALPLVVGDRVLGALDVQSLQGAAFDETSAAVLQAMADQIAIALNNADQFAQARTALQQTQALFAVSQALTEAKTASEILSAVIGYLGAEANRSDLFLYGPRREAGDEEYVEFVATWVHPDYAQDIRPVQPGTRFSPAQMPIVNFIEPDRPLIVRDAQAEETPLSLRNFMQEYSAVALISLPLTVGETMLGALTIGYRTARTFTDDQTQLLMTLARQMAVVLQSQQALATSQAALAQLDKVNSRLIGEDWQDFTETTGGGARKVKLGAGVPLEMAQMPLPSTVAAPVVVGGVEIGVLRLEDAAVDRVWTPTEISVLQTIASEVSVAIEKARLTEQTEKRAQRERTINRITSRIRNAPTIEQMLSIAAQELRLETRASRSFVEVTPAVAGQTNQPDDRGNGHASDEPQA